MSKCDVRNRQKQNAIDEPLKCFDEVGQFDSVHDFHNSKQCFQQKWHRHHHLNIVHSTTKDEFREHFDGRRMAARKKKPFNMENKCLGVTSFI